MWLTLILRTTFGGYQKYPDSLFLSKFYKILGENAHTKKRGYGLIGYLRTLFINQPEMKWEDM